MERIKRMTIAVWGERHKILRFLISGGFATGVDFFFLYAFTEWAGFYYLVSSVLAFLISVAVSFTLQKFWTFENRSLDRVHIQAPLHLTLSLTNILVNTTFLFVLVEYFGIWYIGAQIIAGGFLACVNYFIYKHYIFVE